MNIIKELEKIETLLNNNLEKLSKTSFNEDTEALLQASISIGSAWGGGWLGYHAYVYKRDLKQISPGEHFDTEWGNTDAFSNTTRGTWVEYDHEIIVNAIFKLAKKNLDGLQKHVEPMREIFHEAKDDIIALVEASNIASEKFVQQKLEEIKTLTPYTSRDAFIAVRQPKNFRTRDSRASGGGLKIPPHIVIESIVFQYRSHVVNTEDLKKNIRSLRKFLASKDKKGVLNQMQDKIFIGHGRSTAWKDLEIFLRDRLKLIPREFNSQPTAGIHTTERLDQLLDESLFAFIVMTAEDIQQDGSFRARENVVHEIGLFQGRLGRKRAIILLEEGCSEFSNIAGLGQIRFPKGNIMACAEDIRLVLERENII